MRDMAAALEGSMIASIAAIGGGGGGGVVPTFVQKVSVVDGVDTGTANLLFPINVTAGNLVVLTYFVRGSGATDDLTTAVVTKNSGSATIGTITAAKLDVNHNGGESHAAGIWVIPVTGTGDLTMNISTTAWASGATNRNAVFMEFSLTDVSGALINAVNSSVQNTTTAPVSGNVASGGAGLLVAVLDSSGGGDPTEGGGFTLADEGVNFGSVVYKLVSTATTTQASWGLAVAANCAAVIAAIKAATP